MLLQILSALTYTAYIQQHLALLNPGSSIMTIPYVFPPLTVVRKPQAYNLCPAYTLSLTVFGCLREAIS